MLYTSSYFKNNIECAFRTNRLKRLLLYINFKCPILAQVAAYLLENPGELRGLEPFLELSFYRRARQCCFWLLAFISRPQVIHQLHQPLPGGTLLFSCSKAFALFCCCISLKKFVLIEKFAVAYF